MRLTKIIFLPLEKALSIQNTIIVIGPIFNNHYNHYRQGALGKMLIIILA